MVKVEVAFLLLLALTGSSHGQIGQQLGHSLPSAVMDVGLGYNLLTGNPDGTDWRSGGEDPGILDRYQTDLKSRISFLTEVINRSFFSPLVDVEANVAQEITYTSHDACVTSRSEELIYNPRSYQQELQRRVTFSGTPLPAIQDLAFTLSSGYSVLKADTEQQHYVIQDSSSTCTKGTARYKRLLAGSHMYRLSDEFAAAVCNLPGTTYDENVYIKFLDTWGTHVITGLKLGSRQTNRTLEDVRDYVNTVMKTSPNDVTVVQKAPLESYYQIDVDTLKQRPQYPLPMTGTTYNLHNGETSMLEPISLDLTSIDVALTPAFWPKGGFGSDQCPMDSSSVIESKRQNLLRALQSYGTIKGAVKPTDESLLMPVVWPEGTYGLPKSKTGCPDSNALFLDGWTHHDTETQTPTNSWNASHLAGKLAVGSFDLQYCMKTSQSEEYSLQWPKGDYCIYKYQSCPAGFQEGWILWDDEDTGNTNAHGGIVPDGTYGKDIKMYFCCRNDGMTYEPIVLPTEKPFYLFKYKHGCQSVQGTSHTLEYLVYDNDDSTAHGHGAFSSVNPGMVYNGATAYTMYYCYYVPTQTSVSIIG